MDRCVPVRGYACRNAGNYDKGLFDVVRILCKLLFDGLCLSCFFLFLIVLLSCCRWHSFSRLFR